MKLIVGLGNPGLEFDNTRHNVGFITLDVIAKNLDFKFDNKKFNGLYGEKKIGAEKVIFLKPQMYINLSGEVISKILQYFKINNEDMLIIHDDLDLPVGKYKLRPKGSSAGHNGLKNIELMLGTKEYNRLKIGISNNKTIGTKDYVLGKFTSEEREEIDKVIDTAVDIIKEFIVSDIKTIMNEYNKR